MTRAKIMRARMVGKVRPATTQFYKELILYSAEEFEL